jgi:phage terminase large subunit-like protein
VFDSNASSHDGSIGSLERPSPFARGARAAGDFVPYVTRQGILTAAIENATAGFAERLGMPVEQRDPLKRLFDPDFTQPLWEYEYSKIGPQIPGALHAQQLEAFTHEAYHSWLFWGNQSGKTTIAAVICVMMALGRHPLQTSGQIRAPGVHIWASALTWELWENILLPELLTWIPPDRILDAPPPNRHSTKRDILVLADNGRISRITGKAAEQGAERYQSARIDLVWLDEEHPEAIWDELQPRLLRWRGRSIATMTPLKGLTWVHSRIYEPVQTGRIPRTRHWYSHAGVAANPGITREAIAELTEELKNTPSQLAARLHGHFVRPFGTVYDFDITRDGIELEQAALATFVAAARHYGCIDLGKWRFAFVWFGVDPNGVMVVLDEYFSQNESADVRAAAIDALLTQHHVPESIIIRADCADPDAIKQLNAALERLGSKYYVFPVDAKLKARSAGIMRVESLLTRGALKVRRGIGAGQTWKLGLGAQGTGKPVRGSRWIWEINNWQYPKAADGKVQKDDPDDATADGADMMDATRYGVMTWLGPLDVPTPRKHPTHEEQVWKEALQQQQEEDEETAPGHEYGDVVDEG